MKKIEIPKYIKEDPRALEILSAFLCTDEDMEVRFKAIVDYHMCDSEGWGLVLGTIAKTAAQGMFKTGSNEEQSLAQIRDSFLVCINSGLEDGDTQFFKP